MALVLGSVPILETSLLPRGHGMLIAQDMATPSLGKNSCPGQCASRWRRRGKSIRVDLLLFLFIA